MQHAWLHCLVICVNCDFLLLPFHACSSSDEDQIHKNVYICLQSSSRLRIGTLPWVLFRSNEVRTNMMCSPLTTEKLLATLVLGPLKDSMRRRQRGTRMADLLVRIDRCAASSSPPQVVSGKYICSYIQLPNGRQLHICRAHSY